MNSFSFRVFFVKEKPWWLLIFSCLQLLFIERRKTHNTRRNFSTIKEQRSQSKTRERFSIELFSSIRFQQAGDEDPDESIKELVEITLKKMDKDHDNRLADTDFSASVREDPLLLSCFGQVFANARVSRWYSFSWTFSFPSTSIFYSDSRSFSKFVLWKSNYKITSLLV